MFSTLLRYICRNLYTALIFGIVLTSSPLLYAQSLPELLLNTSDTIRLGAESNSGLTAFPILTMPTSGEYASMAYAYTAVAHDISFFDANAAASSRLTQGWLGFSHNDVIADASLENLAGAYRLGDWGFGGAIRFLHAPFTAYDDLGSATHAFRYTEFLGVLNASYNLFRSYRFSGVAVGVNLKFAYRNIPQSIAPNQSGFSVMGDIGILTGFNLFKTFSSPHPNLTFGVALKNIGVPVLNEPLPSEFVIGVAYAPLKQLLISFDFGLPFTLLPTAPQPVQIAIGIQAPIIDLLSIQAGFALKNNQPYFTLGTTISIDVFNIHLDYILDSTTQFNTLDKISVQAAVSLGDNGRSEQEKIRNELFVSAVEALIMKDYDEARVRALRVIEFDPRFEPASELHTLLQELTDDLGTLESIRVGEDFFSRFINTLTEE